MLRPGNKKDILIARSVRMKYKALGLRTDLSSSVCTLALGLCISSYRCAKNQYPVIVTRV